jgi:hypothetical protein
VNLITSGMFNRSYLAPVVFGIAGIDVNLTCLLHFPGSEIPEYLYGFGTVTFLCKSECPACVC